MKNLKEMVDRYKDEPNGVGCVQWGGKSFYEINSDVPLQLNSYGGKDGYILNEEGQVELFEFFDAPHKYFKAGVEITEEEWIEIEDEINWSSEKEEELELEITHDNCRKWWGLTLDNYYPHPWYPEKKTVAFELVGNLPFNKKGIICEVLEGKNGWIELYTTDDIYSFSVKNCLEAPEFFKPIYI